MSDIVDGLSEYIRAGFDPHNQMKEARSEIERLRAENARLREALEEIANAPVPDTRFNGRGYVPDFDGFKPIARAALAEKEST